MPEVNIEEPCCLKFQSGKGWEKIEMFLYLIICCYPGQNRENLGVTLLYICFDNMQEICQLFKGIVALRSTIHMAKGRCYVFMTDLFYVALLHTLQFKLIQIYNKPKDFLVPSVLRTQLEQTLGTFLYFLYIIFFFFFTYDVHFRQTEMLQD